MSPTTVLLAAALQAAPAAPPKAAPIPAHPDQLKFKDIVFEPPSAAEARVVLKNGMVVFIAEDRALPLVNISLTVRTGRYLEPAGKEGLAALTGSQIRRGGTVSLEAEKMDERLDFLAAQVGSGIGDTSGNASLSCLSDNLDESLALFVEMLKSPRFQEDRLALAKQQELQAMKKRNDDSADIEAREWNALLSGESHFTNHWATEASVKSITRDDMVSFHRAFYHPANMIAAVSGSFDRARMIEKLEAAFAGWPGTKPVVPPVPADISPAAPGLYRVAKDVNQGRVSIGLPTVRRDSPDVYALELMNEVLGGSGFTSRITKTVRSDEGLAYSAGSAIGFGTWYPGRFRAAYQSKSRTVAYAASLVLTEIRKMREALVTAEELDTVKKSIITTFPSSFASASQNVGVFASDEYTGRDPAYWKTYRDRIKAVTAADVQRVTREYLVPEKMILLVVGDLKEIDVGDPKHPGRLEDLLDVLSAGHSTTLALRDPMTMKRP